MYYNPTTTLPVLYYSTYISAHIYGTTPRVYTTVPTHRHLHIQYLHIGTYIYGTTHRSYTTVPTHRVYTPAHTHRVYTPAHIYTVLHTGPILQYLHIGTHIRYYTSGIHCRHPTLSVIHYCTYTIADFRGFICHSFIDIPLISPHIGKPGISDHFVLQSHNYTTGPILQ